MNAIIDIEISALSKALDKAEADESGLIPENASGEKIVGVSTNLLRLLISEVQKLTEENLEYSSRITSLEETIQEKDKRTDLLERSVKEAVMLLDETLKVSNKLKSKADAYSLIQDGKKFNKFPPELLKEYA